MSIARPVVWSVARPVARSVVRGAVVGGSPPPPPPPPPPFSMAAIAVAYYDAADLASQTESDASAPEVADQVYTATNLGTAGTPWAGLVRQTTGPTFRADGTSYYWENTNSGLGTTTSPGAVTVDIFAIVRTSGADTGGQIMREQDSTNPGTGIWLDAATGDPHNGAGTPTVSVDGATVSTRGALYTALAGTGWVVFRSSSTLMTDFVGFRVPAADTVLDVSLFAAVPSADVATHLSDILTFLNARITELDA